MPQQRSKLSSTEEGKIKGLGKGYIRWIVLALLDNNPRSGYELQQTIAEALEGWRPSPGTLYPLLHELDQQKLITGKPDEKEGRHRIIYEITPKGQTQLGAAATQHFLFMSAMRKILGQHGSLHLRKLPSLQVNHVLPKIHKRMKMILEEAHLLPKEVSSDTAKATEELRSRLQQLEQHSKSLQTAIKRVKKQLDKLEKQPSKPD